MWSAVILLVRELVVWRLIYTHIRKSLILSFYNCLPNKILKAPKKLNMPFSYCIYSIKIELSKIFESCSFFVYSYIFFMDTTVRNASQNTRMMGKEIENDMQSKVWNCWQKLRKLRNFFWSWPLSYWLQERQSHLHTD